MYRSPDKRLTFRKRSWLSELDSIERISVWLNAQNGRFHFKMQRRLQMRLM